MVFLYFGRLITQMLLIGVFFAVLGVKGGTVKSPDARRRFRIVRAGASIGLGPMFVVVLMRSPGLTATCFRRRIPAWKVKQVLSLCILVNFSPLTLAYVIVVERAMDLSAVLRQSVKYGLARGGLVAAACQSDRTRDLCVSASHIGGVYRPVLWTFAFAGLCWLSGRRTRRKRPRGWTVSFSARLTIRKCLLGELAMEVGRYVEIDPLFETVAKRISETLHVTDIVILVREGNVYRTRYSTRHGQPMDIVANSRLLSEPGSQVAPLQVYYDQPQPWMRALTTEELQTLAYMRTELLLVMRGRGAEANQVIGLMSLGPKKSQEPYSKTDMSLLQTLAVQMGMAIQNSRLAASLAESAALREVMNREVEIAREVQERLFPQKFPQVAGLDCFGYCRPARGVGGDYYDFLDLPGGRIGIAIGDVSGKGIAAALLMASLQASLRGQAMSGNHDLAVLMRNVNKLVYDASPGNKYATFFYGEYDPATREFAYVNGGHNPPVVLRGEETLLLEATGPVVGLLPGVDYLHGNVSAATWRHRRVLYGWHQ